MSYGWFRLRVSEAAKARREGLLVSLSPLGPARVITFQFRLDMVKVGALWMKKVSNFKEELHVRLS